MRVYPRGCGGASIRGKLVRLLQGLSPRVRGSRPEAGQQGADHGSIPAGAGEPPSTVTFKPESRVYPRGCGGAPRISKMTSPSQGLSPRVRGSLAAAATSITATGSIPAGAGEPPINAVSSSVGRVYPRGCGGARYGGCANRPGLGLSPRVRGSLLGDCLQGIGEGSIPAGAGEPGSHPLRACPPRVYPRGCGGAHTTTHGNSAGAGLSPRVRGSLMGTTQRLSQCGSIPAGAGEPHCADWQSEDGWVYPRGCGGAAAGMKGGDLATGLSPRVRGSPPHRAGLWGGGGSIPAGAGEPQGPIAHKRRWWVYPRGCGGARQ